MTIVYQKGINDKKEPCIVKKFGSILKFKEHVNKFIDDLLEKCEEEFYENEDKSAS